MTHISIFADLERSETEARKRKEARRSRKDSYLAELQEGAEKLREEAMGLIPYSGQLAISVAAALVSDTPEEFIFEYPDSSGFKYYGQDSFVGTQEAIDVIITPQWNKGIRADGTVYYTTPFGVVFPLKKEIPEEKMTIVNGWIVATTEWMFASLTMHEYFTYDHACLRSLRDLLPAMVELRKKQQVEASENAEKKMKDRATEILTSIGEKIDDVSMELTRFIMFYDFTWEYSDDHEFCLRYSARLKIVKSRLTEYPKLEAYFAESIKNYFQGNK